MSLIKEKIEESKRSEEIIEFINAHKDLFWYTPKDRVEHISDELLLEVVINYCELDEVLKLFNLMGLKNVQGVLESMQGRKRNNIYPELYNYFTEYLKYVL